VVQRKGTDVGPLTKSFRKKGPVTAELTAGRNNEGKSYRRGNFQFPLPNFGPGKRKVSKLPEWRRLASEGMVKGFGVQN